MSTSGAPLKELPVPRLSNIKFTSLKWICREYCNPWTSLFSRDGSWWRHQMEAFSALLALCAGNSPVIGEFPSQRPVTGSFDVSFDLGLHKWLSKHLWPRWFEMPSRSLWCHCDVRSIPRIFIMKSMLWLVSWYHVALPRIKQSALHINVLMVAQFKSDRSLYLRVA